MEMKELEKYNRAFEKTFKIQIDETTETLEQKSLLEWDSLGQMRLITAIESEFGIMLEMNDIKKFTSYKAGIEILKKYNITI